MGFIFQSFNLIPVLSVFENVEYPLLLRRLAPRERRRRVDELLLKVGLADTQGEAPSACREGNASASPRPRPRDRPAARYRRRADRLARSRDRKIGHGAHDRDERDGWARRSIFATHDPAMAEFANRVVTMSDGRIVSDRAVDMKNLLIASRNLLRHKRKTLVVLSGLVFGLAGMVVFQGFLGESMRGFRDSDILSGLGHLEVAGRRGLLRGRRLRSLRLSAQGRRGPVREDRSPGARRRGGLPFGRLHCRRGLRRRLDHPSRARLPPERMYFSLAQGRVAAPIDRLHRSGPWSRGLR